MIDVGHTKSSFPFPLTLDEPEELEVFRSGHWRNFTLLTFSHLMEQQQTVAEYMFIKKLPTQNQRVVFISGFLTTD